MSTAEIKSLLHKLIVETDDPSILSQVADFFNIIKFKNTKSWDNISPQEQGFIELGIQQMKDGLGIPHEEVRKRIDLLLKKKQA